MRTLICVSQDQMGSGDTELGRKILATYLRKAVAIDGLDAIAFYNSGVRLLADGSPVLAELSMLAERGVDLLPCGTCVAHLGITLRVGAISDMDSIVQHMSSAQKVITLG